MSIVCGWLVLHRNKQLFAWSKELFERWDQKLQYQSSTRTRFRNLFLNLVVNKAQTYVLLILSVQDLVYFFPDLGGVCAFLLRNDPLLSGISKK